MIFNIKSENTYLLDILNKNPNTDFGLYAKRLKNGVVVGNCVSKNHYEITFQDSKYSYLPEDSNALDFQSFASPLAILHISNEFLGHLIKSKSSYLEQEIKWLSKPYKEVDNQQCILEISTLYVNSSWARGEKFLLSKYFPQMEAKHKVGHNYQLTITAQSVFEAVNLLNLVAVLVHITNNYGIYTYINDNFAEKYVRMLTNLDRVPYFVFYLFIKRAMKSEKQFQMFKADLEAYFQRDGLEVDFKFGYNHQERVRYITERIDMKQEILDFGCGEFIYYKKLDKMNFDMAYHAIDEEVEFSKLAEVIQKRSHLDNLKFYQSMDDFLKTYNNQALDIILTEVIEHNPIDEAKKIIENLLKLHINQLFITTPNKDFNSYYFDNETDMRHDDHDFELTQSEFIQFIQAFNLEQYDVVFDQIGDSINGVCPTQICIIKKKLS